MDRHSHHWWLVGFFLTVLLPVPLRAQPLAYSSKEIRGQVVDAETDRPIVGAVVIATWNLYLDIGHGGHQKRLHLTETTTDGNGNYILPSWGPKPRPPQTHLSEWAPALFVFKSGYRPEVRNNERMSSSAVRMSEWDGKIIRLQRPQGTLEKQASFLGSVYRGLCPNIDDEPTDWKNYPRATLEVLKEKQRLRALGLKLGYGPDVIDLEKLNDTDRAFLKGVEK
jgi:hypothetical protein